MHIRGDIAWKICLLGHVTKCSGRFIVSVNRRVTSKLYLTAAHEREPWRCHKPHCDLRNAARQVRIDAYRPVGKTIGFAARCRSLTEIRGRSSRIAALNAHSAQVTLKRPDLALRHSSGV